MVFLSSPLKENRAYYFLFASLICFVIVFTSDLFDLVGAEVPQIVFRIFLAGFMGFSLLFHLINSKKTSVYNVQQILRDIAKYGVCALCINIIPDLLDLLIDGASKTWSHSIFHTIELLGFFASVHFLLYGLTFLKKLFFVKANENVLQLWNIYSWIIGLSAFALVMNAQLLNLMGNILLISGLLVLLALIFRLKWVAFLNEKAKWSAILFFMLILLCTAGIAQKLLQTDLYNFIDEPMVSNAFLILVGTGVSSYSLLSLLALLFNLPITSVIEERDSEIKSFQQISQSIIKKDSPEKTFELLFKNCYRTSNSDAGCIKLFGEGGEEEILYSNIEQGEIERLDSNLNIAEVVGFGTNKGHHYVGNLVKRGIFRANEFPYQSVLLFPIHKNNYQLQAVIILLRSMAGGFDEYTVKLVRSYVQQAKVSLEMAELVEQNLEGVRVKEELEIARRVQENLFPANFPKSDYFEIIAESESAYEVGGDYYDYHLDGIWLDVIIADVAGSGSAAAFHMAELKGIFQSLVQLRLPLKKFMEITNIAVSQSMNRALFTALTFLKFDLKERKLRYARAGHTPILFYRHSSGKAEYLEDEGMGMGILRDDSYNDFIRTYDVQLEKGDIIALFTDGLTETKNTSGEQYGLERLREHLEEIAHIDVEAIKNSILRDCNSFKGSMDYRDDSTIVVVKIK